jgi:F0F1-type ATP synthase assembly protein I
LKAILCGRKVTVVNYDKGVYRSLTQILQFGINMLVPIVICTFLGIGLDRFFHTSFLVIILFFLGAAAGARNVYIFAKQIFDRPPVHDEVRVRRSGNGKHDTQDTGDSDVTSASK